MTGDWSALIGPLVDGEPLDWPTLERTLGSDSEELRRLRRIAALCSGLAAAQPPRPGASDAGAGGFAWGHLRVLGRLGGGSSGEVHRAFDTVLEREVALKLLRDDGAGQARAFIAEARRLAQVRHPNVLAVHGAAIHDGRAGLWADLVEGRSLRDWVAGEGARPAAQVLEAGIALAAALAAVHAAGLVHGDVKPANVVREEDGGRLVLMDFGSAGNRDEAGRHGLLGSPLSMAPEQLRGEPVGPSADLYGLGVVLYFLAAGKVPVAAPTLTALAQAHTADQARSAALRLAELPRALRGLVADLLAGDPARRPDAAQVLARLDRIVQAPRRRRRRAAVVAIVGSLGLGLAAALLGLHSARQSAQVASVERERAEAVNRFLVDVMAAPGDTHLGEQVRVVDLLEQSVARLHAGALSGQPGAEAGLWQILGRSFAAVSRADEARAELREAWLRMQAGYGAQDPRTLEAERLLLAHPAPGGDPADRLQSLRDLHARALAATDALHPLPALVAADLAGVHLQLGQVDPARQWLETPWQQRARVRWQNPLDRSVLEVLWLQLLQRLGDTPAMLASARETRAWVQAHAGERHRNALLARNLEIGALLQLGRLADAEREAQAMYQQASAWLDEDNPLVVAALGSWATSLTEQGRTGEALPLSERRLALSRRRSGADSPQAMVAALNLANVARAERDWPRAQALYAEVIDTLPERSDIALLARGNLAELYLDQERYAQADTAAATALSLLEESLGRSHLFTHHARAMHGAAQRGLGRPAQALTLLQDAAGGIEGALGPDHQLTWTVRYHLALAQADLSRRDEAIALLAGVVERRGARMGADHPLTRKAADALARLRGAGG